MVQSGSGLFSENNARTPGSWLSRKMLIASPLTLLFLFIPILLHPPSLVPPSSLPLSRGVLSIFDFVSEEDRPRFVHAYGFSALSGVLYLAVPTAKIVFSLASLRGRASSKNFTCRVSSRLKIVPFLLQKRHVRGRKIPVRSTFRVASRIRSFSGTFLFQDSKNV